MLREVDDVIVVAEIVTGREMNLSACDQLLYKMANQGQIVGAKRGHCCQRDRADLTPCTRDKISKKIRNSDVEGRDDD